MTLYAVIYRLPSKAIVGDIYESKDKAIVMAKVASDTYGCPVKVVPLQVPEGI